MTNGFRTIDELDLVTEIVARAREERWLLGTAESCTGGGIAKLITDVPGVSDVFAGGVVTYSDDLKKRILGVSADTLTKYGAVSRNTAVEMVRGLAGTFQVHIGIATTGIAGPAGGTAVKPVGLVYIATCVGDNIVVSENNLGSNRQGIRDATCRLALSQLRDHLVSAPQL